MGMDSRPKISFFYLLGLGASLGFHPKLKKFDITLGTTLVESSATVEKSALGSIHLEPGAIWMMKQLFILI